MKKTIRLTESDLHRVIKESVKQCLTELDWKTYQNAAEKAYDRYLDNDDWKEADRADAFADAAERSFNDTYPRERGRFSHDMEYDAPRMTYDSPHGIASGFSGEGGSAEYYPLQRRGRVSKGEMDFSNHLHGQSKYVKGKGWQ